MIPTPVFLDTFALVALASSSDEWHARAKLVEATLAAQQIPLATSDWVLSEFLNTGSSVHMRSVACRVVRLLCSSRRTTVFEATRGDWVKTLDLYESRTDKSWSFTDCSSILLCRVYGIARVFSHDHHFVQAGFEILLP